MTGPTLVAVSHGTDSADGRAAISALVRRVRMLVAGDVRETYVDVQQPQLSEVLAGLTAPSIIVPLLLSPGFHHNVDIAAAARAARQPARVTAPLGEDARVCDVLDHRLDEIGCRTGDALVLGAAGSRDRRSSDSVVRVANRLARRRGQRVVVGYVGGTGQRIDEVIAAERGRAPGTRIVVANYHVAPGRFSGRLRSAGADLVTPPLIPGDGAVPETLAQVVVDHYRGALAA